MYKPATTFIFPHLVFLKDVSFKSWSDSKTTKIYKLDWDSFDEAILKRHIARKANCWPSTEFKLVQKFDSYYETLLHSLRFAIPNDYLTEIRRMTQMALSEWGTSRTFDTDIREMCLGPAIECIKVAFKLIADCAYDENSNYFLRVNNKYLLAPLMLFRFWQHQTGSGLIADNSGFDKLESKLAWLKFTSDCADDVDYGTKAELHHLDRFLKSFKNQAESIQKAISSNSKLAVGGSHVGPVISESLEKKPEVYI